MGAARYHLVISDRLLFTSPLYEADRVETTVQLEPIHRGVLLEGRLGLGRGDSRPTARPWRFRVTSQNLHDKEDTTPPILEITENVQSGPMLILNGRTEPVRSCGWTTKGRCDRRRYLYAVVRLRKEGVNDVSLMAQDASGNVRKLNHRAYVDAY